MEVIRAREMMVDYTTAVFPNLKSKDRSKKYHLTLKKAYPAEIEKMVKKTDDLSIGGKKMSSIEDFVKAKK